MKCLHDTPLSVIVWTQANITIVIGPAVSWPGKNQFEWERGQTDTLEQMQ